MEQKKEETNFKELKDKKILLYGTRKNAERIVKQLTGYHIVGVIDRIRVHGDFMGIPILLLEEIEEGIADVIVIAASKSYYREIYDRIIDRCIACNIRILSMEGKELIMEFGVPYIHMKSVQYYKRNEDELKKLICQYEAISFDLFDTLIMRKLLEPTDLFDKLKEIIAKQGIFIKEFKKIRQEAERDSNGGNIYQIYKILQEKTEISTVQRDQILEEEIKLEKKYLIKREKMVQLMEYAIEQGKEVAIISDMYLPSEILTEILNSLGIKGYTKLYVSCEYGVSKCNGLYHVYITEMGNKKGLHIGDNQASDIFAAKEAGLETYGIKSALDMMKRSSLRKSLIYVKNWNEKGLMGLLISKLFNDPFVLYGTSGVVKVIHLKMVGQLFVAPFVILYMLELFRKLSKETYTGVLFPTRDGYLLKKIYDQCYKKSLLGEQEIPSFYFAASRKLCLKAFSDRQISLLKEHDNVDCQKALQEIIGIQEAGIYDENIYHSEKEYYEIYSSAIKEKAQQTRKNYKKYIEQCGISLDKNYLFCELSSQGTIHYILNKIFRKPLKGLYLCRNVSKRNKDLSIDAIYLNCGKERCIVAEKTNFLETILTSKEASVCDVDENGKVILSEEIRTKKELSELDIIQEGIEEIFFEFIGEMYTEGIEINKKLPELLLELSDNVEYEEECDTFYQKKLYEDLSGRYMNILNI